MIIRIAIFYILTIFFTFLLGGIQQAVGINPPLTALPQWGPGIAGLLMLLIFRKDDLALNFKLKKIPSKKFWAAFLLPFIPAVLIFPTVWITQPSFALPSDLPPMLILATSLALGAMGEEIGWRGYLQVRLNWELKPLVSPLIVGTLWGLWHFGFYQNGPVFVLLAVIVFIAISVIMALLLMDIDFNLWVASLFHYGINLSSLVYFSVINQTSFMLFYAAAWTAVAAITVLWSRRRTGKTISVMPED